MEHYSSLEIGLVSVQLLLTQNKVIFSQNQGSI